MRPWFWMSSMCAASLAACGGKVVLDSASTITSGAGGTGGTGGFTFSSDEASGTSVVSSGDGVPACNPCGAVLNGAAPDTLCGSTSGGLFMNLVSCLCAGDCAMDCQVTCEVGGMVSTQCEMCAVSPAGGCSMQVQACLDDTSS
jgi:hypothetical protein